MEKKSFRISLWGCDDSTEFDMFLTNDEFELVKRICDRSEEVSTCICMPTMEIEEIN